MAIDTTGPLVIGHRGACGYRPEHTLESYRLAVRLGADVIEPDLVVTRDGELVARHENDISHTTDVASRPEFAGRRATRTVDGRTVTGWFTEDFTLAELRTLRAVERLPGVRPSNTVFDGRFTVPTMREVLELAAAESRRLGRAIGVYPETKHPAHFRALGLGPEEPLAALLAEYGHTGPADPVLVQSFEPGSLRRLAGLTGVRLVQLLDAAGRPADLAAAGDRRGYADLATPAGLAEIAGYAYGVGAAKELLVPRDATGRLLPATAVVHHAHEAGLVVHAWTFRAENRFLPLDFRIGADPHARGDVVAEYELYLRLGVDGFFSDHPDTARAAVAGALAPA